MTYCSLKRAHYLLQIFPANANCQGLEDFFLPELRHNCQDYRCLSKAGTVLSVVE